MSASLDARLRGFPENNPATVLNAAPTAAGSTTRDRDHAGRRRRRRSRLTADLTAEVADALADARRTIADAVDPPPRQRSRASTASSARATSRKSTSRIACRGTIVADRGRGGRGRAPSSCAGGHASALPTGHELLPAAIEVTIREARVDGNALVVTSPRPAASAADRRRGDPDRIRGQSASEAKAALEALGPADVDLWPGWVGIGARLDGESPAIGSRTARGAPSGATWIRIGLDHGSRRIGVAVGDIETGMAFARPALRRRSLDDDLALVGELCIAEGRGTSWSGCR